MDLLEALKSRTYDQLDFGCSAGGALVFGKDTLGAKRGLGLDISPAKVAKANASGFEAQELDVTTVGDYPDAVSFVTLFHFLEHLPSYDLAKRCIHAAHAAARDFVFIRQPWFDSDGELFKLGYKCYWSDWRGHPLPVSVLNLHKMIDAIGPDVDYRIYGRKRIRSTMDPAILPLSAAPDSSYYNDDEHAKKENLPIRGDAFYESAAIIKLSSKVSYKTLESTMNPEILFRSKPVPAKSDLQRLSRKIALLRRGRRPSSTRKT